MLLFPPANGLEGRNLHSVVSMVISSGVVKQKQGIGYIYIIYIHTDTLLKDCHFNGTFLNYAILECAILGQNQVRGMFYNQNYNQNRGKLTDLAHLFDQI